MEDSLEKLRADIVLRKLRQNERRVKAGKKALHKIGKPAKAPSRSTRPPMPESGDIQDSAMSFDEWRNSGYAVKKGQKADHFSIEGVPQFILTQVQRANPAWEKWRNKK